jgi:hypothetical protein
MIRKIIKSSDFNTIRKEHDYFIWSFLSVNPGCLTIKSVLGLYGKGIKGCSDYNDMTEILNIFKDLPYFESFSHESIDFLMNQGLPGNKLWVKGHFNPVVVAFKKGAMIGSTFDFCYCAEGVTDLIYKLNPELILNTNSKL